MRDFEQTFDKILWCLIVIMCCVCGVMIANKKDDNFHKEQCVRQYKTIEYAKINGDVYCKSGRFEYRRLKGE